MKFALPLVLTFLTSLQVYAQNNKLEEARRLLMEFTNTTDVIVNGKTPQGLDCSAEVDIEEEVNNTITFDTYDSSDHKIRMTAAGFILNGSQSEDTITSARQKGSRFEVKIASRSLRSGEIEAGSVILTRNGQGKIIEIAMTKGSKSIDCISDEE
jgi:hypothetical protein